MKQVKPVVIGYVRVLVSGRTTYIRLSKDRMVTLSKSKGVGADAVHLNGKQKFRPVYAEGVTK